MTEAWARCLATSYVLDDMDFLNHSRISRGALHLPYDLAMGFQ